MPRFTDARPQIAVYFHRTQLVSNDTLLKNAVGAVQVLWTGQKVFVIQLFLNQGSNKMKKNKRHREKSKDFPLRMMR